MNDLNRATRSFYLGLGKGIVALLVSTFFFILGGQVDAQTTRQPEKTQTAQKQGGVMVDVTSGTRGARGADPAGKFNQISRDNLRKFSEGYRLGPSDTISVHVKGQPDYSLDKIRVSPLGTIYHPLLGDISIAGMSVGQLKKQLTNDLAEYLLDPIVNIEVVEVQSAKVGVLGEVRNPQLLVMTGPMTILDAITGAGGFAETGKMSNVTLLRQNQTIKVNVKQILKGKASLEDNLALQPGDMVIVHGNAMKLLPILNAITSITGMASLSTIFIQ